MTRSKRPAATGSAVKPIGNGEAVGDAIPYHNPPESVNEWWKHPLSSDPGQQDKEPSWLPEIAEAKKGIYKDAFPTILGTFEQKPGFDEDRFRAALETCAANLHHSE